MEIKKVCYAIMPYGGDDPELKRRYDTVYQLFMQLPAIKNGFEMMREDFNPQAGTITHNIVSSLSKADLVIADLSGGNWNVAYELGIRHTLFKGRTILLCDEETELKFDIRNVNVIRYKGDIISNDLQDIQRKVENAIANRMSASGKADNIVHEALGLPYEKLMSYVSSEGTDLRKEYDSLLGEFEKIKSELTRYKSEEAQNEEEKRSAQYDILSRKISDAFQAIEYSGDQIVFKLRELTAVSQPNYIEIQNVLEKALIEGYLTESNFRSMYVIFKKQGIPQLTNLILEIAAERYPQSLDFKSYLADAYSDNYLTFDKAIQYADEVLQIRMIDGKRISKCKKIDSDQLSSCLNAYIGVCRYDILIEIIPVLLNEIPEHKEILLRCLSIGYKELGYSNEEKGVLKQLIEEYPLHDVNHYRASAYYLRTNDYLQAYYHMLLASVLDPDDTNYLFAIAGIIFDRHFYVDEFGNKTELKDKTECARVVVPFLMRVISTDLTQSTLQKCMDFILRNSINKYASIVNDWINEGMKQQGIPDLNYSGVKCLESLLKNQNQDVYGILYLENGLCIST